MHCQAFFDAGVPLNEMPDLHNDHTDSLTRITVGCVLRRRLYGREMKIIAMGHETLTCYWIGRRGKLHLESVAWREIFDISPCKKLAGERKLLEPGAVVRTVRHSRLLLVIAVNGHEIEVDWTTCTRDPHSAVFNIDDVIMVLPILEPPFGSTRNTLVARELLD